MKQLFLLGFLWAFATSFVLASDAETQLLDQENLSWKTLHGDAEMAPLALTEAGKPQVILLRLPKGGVLTPHSSEAAKWHVITVVGGTLSYADGDVLEEGKFQDYPAGSVLLLPENVSHFAAARQDDVLLQIILASQDSLAADVRGQLTQQSSTSSVNTSQQAE
jgi:quercetin dioxygenase-like cupin family protein